MGQSRPLFLFIFVLFTFQFKWQIYNLNNINWKKRRWCAWDSNPGRQDGRRRQIHWAIAAPLVTAFFHNETPHQAQKLWPHFRLSYPLYTGIKHYDWMLKVMCIVSYTKSFVNIWSSIPTFSFLHKEFSRHRVSFTQGHLNLHLESYIKSFINIQFLYIGYLP